MRNLKKFLALVLAMMMAVSLMVTADAKNPEREYPDMGSVTEAFEEAVDTLTGMGIFKGDYGNFKPQAFIMRSEAVAVLYRLVTGDVTDSQAKLYIPAAHFNDVSADAWYAGYVGFAVDRGLVKGYNGNFMPNKNVTGYEMLAMLLRAVGYGKNGEYTGNVWQINVGSQAQALGILDNINSTHYASTLSQPSAREVVAELTFYTAAYVPTVRYEFGYYNQYKGVAIAQGNNELNPTLGQIKFGLTDLTGIVVGNQATGESRTLVGAGVDAVYRINADSTFTLLDVVLNGSVSYSYDDVDPTDTTSGNVTFGFDAETGLDLFGHKVKVWSNSNGHAYSVIDEATWVKTVWADDLKTNGSTSGKTSVYDAAVGAGFKKGSAPAHLSDRFSQIGDNDSNAAVQSKVGMYRIISNSNDKSADVVISLNQEVAQITQRNSTVKGGEYIYLGKGSSKFGATLSDGNSGKLLDSLLAPDSDMNRGDVVTANEIVGTTWTGMTGDGESDALDRTITNTLSTAYCRYETKELKPAFTGTISTYKQYASTDIAGNNALSCGDGSTEYIISTVTLTDSKSWDLSGITGSDVPNSSDPSVTHLVDKALTPLTSANTRGGVTYTFYLDELDRFIGVGIPNEYKFLYTTFADYEIGALGTGTISYYAYGVDWDGNIVKTGNKITSIELPLDGDTEFFADNAALSIEPLSVSGSFLARGYNRLPVTMKDQGASLGNQIKNGGNTRFMIDGDGHMTWFREGKDYGNRFLGWYDTEKDAASNTWTITAQDAKNGFVRVYNQGGDMKADSNLAAAVPDAAANVDYLLTNDTKFIVVTGSGTDDLNVKTYNGLTELLDGDSTVEISCSYSLNSDNVYFLTGEQQYGNVNVSKNNTITTVILSNSNLFRYSTNNLYFAAPGATATGVKLASASGSIEQYKLYNNGKADYYWVNKTMGDEAVGTATEENGDDATVGNFYTLAKIATISGQPIYKAVRVTGNGSNKVGQLYNYVTVNNVNTVEIGTAPNATVYKVGDALVAEAFGSNTPVITTNNIDDMLKLNNAVSMGTSNNSGDLYSITVAIVYSGINVSCIYITNIAST